MTEEQKRQTDIDAKMPHGFAMPGKVPKLCKSTMGLKQSPSNVLPGSVFRPLKAILDNIYTHQSSSIQAYVDDFDLDLYAINMADLENELMKQKQLRQELEVKIEKLEALRVLKIKQMTDSKKEEHL